MEQFRLALRRIRVEVSSGKDSEYLAEERAGMTARSSSEPDKKMTSSTLGPLRSEMTNVALPDWPLSLVRKGILMLRISVSAAQASGRVRRAELEPAGDEDFRKGRKRVICSVSFCLRLLSGDGSCPNAAFAK